MTAGTPTAARPASGNFAGRVSTSTALTRTRSNNLASTQDATYLSVITPAAICGVEGIMPLFVIGDGLAHAHRQLRLFVKPKTRLHRRIKRRVRSMLDFKSFRAAALILADIEMVQMMRKRQGRFAFNPAPTLKEQFEAMAA